MSNHSNNRQFSLTTPLYYVNDVPHIGSAYTTMVADAIARFKRLQGYDVLLITGTDEHGQKIERTALERGLDPQTHCDRVVASFQNLWQKLNIQYNSFIRTTDRPHAAIVKEFFQKVWDRGDIYLDRQQGWYCVACEEFKEERELLEGGFCSIHPNKKVEWRDEENYFFALSKYQQKLEEFYEQNHHFIEPESRRNEVVSFIKGGLKDFSISRINLEWGFPLPIDSNHTIYVWFDALLGYITALLDRDREPTLENALSQWWPIDLHLIGKDILRFHALYWPAMLMSANLPLPKQVFGHGFLTKDGQKMGKALGNTIDPFALVDNYGSDPIRYYFLKEIELGKDGDFNETRFINIVNADLANDLGNLLNRSLGMLIKYCEGKGVNLTGADINNENILKKIGLELEEKATQAYEILRFDRACEEIFNLIRASNKYIDESAPWSLYKKGERQEVEKILYAVLESIRLSAYLLSPIIPNLSSAIYQQLGFEVDFNDRNIVDRLAPYARHCQWGSLPINQNLTKGTPIFSKIEPIPAS
jgi:methionyl-tRNA synthetase